jgi:hypothetical protein
MTSSETFRFECPFDLETIFTVQVDMKNLKGILEFILERLGKEAKHNTDQDKKINDLDLKLVQKLMQVDK